MKWFSGRYLHARGGTISHSSTEGTNPALDEEVVLMNVTEDDAQPQDATQRHITSICPRTLTQGRVNRSMSVNLPVGAAASQGLKLDSRP